MAADISRIWLCSILQAYSLILRKAPQKELMKAPTYWEKYTFSMKNIVTQESGYCITCYTDVYVQ